MNLSVRPLTPEQKEEKNYIALDCYKLGFLLMLYQLLTYGLRYVFYLAAYWVCDGNFTLNVKTAMNYLVNNQDIVQSTAFKMSGNISITCVSLAIVMVGMHSLFKGQLGSWLRPDKKKVLTGVLWTTPDHVVNLFATMIVSYLVTILGNSGISVPDADFTITHPSAAAIILQAAYTILAAPVIEEILYRGMILSVLSKYGKSPAVLLSALCFGLMHGNIPQGVGAFISGLLYAIVAVESGSIVPSIIMHSFNNLMAEMTDITSALGVDKDGTIVMSIIAVAGFIGFFVGCMNVNKLRFKEEQHALSIKQVRQTVFSNPMTLICLLWYSYSIISGLIGANS